MPATPTSCTAAEVPSELRRIYQAHGYCLVRGFLDAAALDAARAELARIIDGRLMPEKNYQYDDVEVPETLKQMQSLNFENAYFAQLMNTRLKDLAEAALGAPVVVRNLQYFAKPPRDAYRRCAHLSEGRRTPAHQDAFYMCLEDDSGDQATTLWLALDEADAENGCLRYVRGSAAEPVRAHTFSGCVGFSQTIVGYDEAAEDEVVMAAAPGDAILHHQRIVHRAGANESESRPRRALGAVFYSESAKVDQARFERQSEEIRRRVAALDGQGGEKGAWRLEKPT